MVNGKPVGNLIIMKGHIYMNDAIEILKQIKEDVEACGIDGDHELFYSRMLANAVDIEIFLTKLHQNNG